MDGVKESRKEARVRILELANIISVPMSLNAAVRLNVPEVIWQGGANTPLSASKILGLILPGGGGDAENLQRILRLLTTYGVFEEHLGIERKYSLTELGKTLVADEEGISYAPYVLRNHHDAFLRAWSLLHESVVDPTREPFERANGMGAYEYYVQHPEINELMLRAMSGISVPLIRAMLDTYDGFNGVDTLVDVGGSSGNCLRMILQKHPNIKQAINFDLPGVVAKAPHIPGVTHVGGDMFKSIPQGDAIFIKGVLLTVNDEDCKLIIQNCYKSLPEGGKLIVCDLVLPQLSDESYRTRALLDIDVLMMTIYKGKANIRTAQQFKQIAVSAGFTSFKAFIVDHFDTILEFHK